MTALATQEAAQRRSKNFFRDRRGREPQVAFDSLEAQALIVVRASIEAHAQSIHRDLSPADLSRMLAAAQSQLRGLSPEDLRGISSSSILKTITDYSFSATPVGDPRSQAELAAAAALEQGTGADAGAKTLAARWGHGGSSARYSSALGGGERFSQADTQKIAAAMSVACEYGMTWMTPHDLLAIGPAGVKAIAETSLKETGYKALRESSYAAKDIATFAMHSKIRGFDAEQAALATRDLTQAQPTSQAAEALAETLKAYDRAVVDAYTKPDDSIVRQKLEEAGRNQKAVLQGIAAQGPEQAKQVRRLEDAKNIEERFRATIKAEAKADAKIGKADVKDEQIDAGLAALKGDDKKLDAQLPKSTDIPPQRKAVLPTKSLSPNNK